MPFPYMAAAAGLGAISSFLTGNKANKNQSRALDQQGQIANQQGQMFQQANPYYAALLQAYGQHAGFTQGPPQPGPDQAQGGLAGNLGFTQPGAQQPGAMHPPANPYSFPEDRLRYQQANENITNNAQRAGNQLSYGMQRRGMGGSNYDVQGRAALLANANQQRAGFERQQLIDAPNQYAQRLGMLMNALNPGLGAGPSAAGMYGQQGQIYGQQASEAGGNLGGIMQQMAYLQALKQPTGATPGFGTQAQFGVPGASQNYGYGGYPQINLGDFMGGPK